MDSALGEGCKWCRSLCGFGGFFHQHVGVSMSTGISAQSGSHGDNQARERCKERIVVTPINSEGNGVGNK